MKSKKIIVKVLGDKTDVDNFVNFLPQNVITEMTGVLPHKKNKVIHRFLNIDPTLLNIIPNAKIIEVNTPTINLFIQEDDTPQSVILGKGDELAALLLVAAKKCDKFRHLLHVVSDELKEELISNS